MSLGSLHLLVWHKNNQNCSQEAFQFPHTNTLNKNHSDCGHEWSQTNFYQVVPLVVSWRVVLPLSESLFFFSPCKCVQTCSTTTFKQCYRNHRPDMRSTPFNMWFLNSYSQNTKLKLDCDALLSYAVIRNIILQYANIVTIKQQVQHDIFHACKTNLWLNEWS